MQHPYLSIYLSATVHALIFVNKETPLPTITWTYNNTILTIISMRAASDPSLLMPLVSDSHGDELRVWRLLGIITRFLPSCRWERPRTPHCWCRWCPTRTATNFASGDSLTSDSSRSVFPQGRGRCHVRGSEATLIHIRCQQKTLKYKWLGQSFYIIWFTDFFCLKCPLGGRKIKINIILLSNLLYFYGKSLHSVDRK